MLDEVPVLIPDGFRGLDLRREIRIYRRGLPHWRQDGATYFVTFRLADALPQSALRDLEIERKNFKALVEGQALGGGGIEEGIGQFLEAVWPVAGTALGRRKRQLRPS